MKGKGVPNKKEPSKVRDWDREKYGGALI